MEKVKFENRRGLELAGNYHDADSDKGIVMSHGFTGDKHERGYFDRVAETLNKAGYKVLAFDFSGSGESNGSPVSAEREIEDLNAAIDYIQSRGAEKIGLYGHSLGGYISLKNFSPEIEAMVLTSPVTASIDLSEHNLIWRLFAGTLGRAPSLNYWRNKRQLMWVDTEIVDKMKNVDQEELLSGVNCPILVIHGNKDKVVKLEDSEEAVEKLENAELKVIHGLTHDYDSHLKEVVKAAENWFDDHLD